MWLTREGKETGQGEVPLWTAKLGEPVEQSVHETLTIQEVGVMRSRTWPGYRDRCAAH